MPYKINPFTNKPDYFEAGSGGDVVGPGSSTADSLAYFTDTSGKVLGSSGYTINSGNLTGDGFVAQVVLESDGIFFQLGQFNILPTIVSATPYALTSTDYYLSMQVAAAAATVTLPANPSSNTVIYVKDALCQAGTYNITIDGNGQNIAGSASASNYVLNNNGEAVMLVFNGTFWEVN